MSVDQLQTPETEESLHSDVLYLKARITRQNIINNINQLTLPLKKSQKLYKAEEWYANLPEVLITESSISKDEQKQLPLLQQALHGDIYKKLIILPNGSFSDSITEIQDTLDFDKVLQCYALIKKPDFRRVVETGWEKVFKHLSDESNKLDNSVDQYIETHRLELLKELKSDMQAVLSSIDSH